MFVVNTAFYNDLGLDPTGPSFLVEELPKVLPSYCTINTTLNPTILHVRFPQSDSSGFFLSIMCKMGYLYELSIHNGKRCVYNSGINGYENEILISYYFKDLVMEICRVAKEFDFVFD
jgi:hypothetical protein